MWNSLVDHANFAGDRWAVWVLATLLDSTVLLMLVGVLWLAVRKHVAPQVGYCLFLLIPLKVLVPVQISVPAAIAQWAPSAILSSFWNQPVEIAERSVPNEVAAVSTVETVSTSSIARDLRPVSMPPAINAPTHVENPSPSMADAVAVTPAFDTIDSRPTSPVSAPRLPAILLFSWLGGVLLLAVRMIWTQWRFRAQIRRASPIDETQLTLNFGALCQRAGISQRVRLVESDRIAAPAVWGLFRPTIILPRGIVASLTVAQLRWVLLHELAHVRRRDLFAILVQRCAAILQFFNPSVWLANRIANHLREYACDDFAVSMSEGSRVESGEAFVEVLRNANRRHRALEGTLGVFGLDTRASCFRRVQRLLDTERPIRTRASRLSLCALAVFAIVALPNLRPSSDAADPASATETPATSDASDANSKSDAEAKNSAPKERPKAPSAPGRQIFELQVASPDRKPVPRAEVRLLTSPIPKAKQILRGEFVNYNGRATMLKADSEGRITLDVPIPSKKFILHFETPGYGPYWADWSSHQHPQTIPSTFTVELEAGWSVGGKVVDSDGKPVSGAKVHPSLEFKKRPGDLQQLGVGTEIKTDSNGRWRYDCVPVSKADVSVSIVHPEFMNDRRTLGRAVYEIKDGQEPTGKILLDRGVAVTGKITDDAGKPLVGALVRTKFVNDVREAFTETDGTYRLVGCGPGMAKIVASAKGRATDMQIVMIDPAMKPVDFRLPAGGHIRVRVIGEQNKPIPKARIVMQWWREHSDYFEFDHFNQYADDNGVWEWNEAPLDEFQADICRPDGMNLANQPLIARTLDYVFSPPPALIISGKVIDAETKQPIEKFQVVPGLKLNASNLQWDRNQSFTASGGRYQFRGTYDYFAHLVRIEADGYQSASSRDIKSNEGRVTIDFELKRKAGISATVLSPDGKPARGAQVAQGIAGSQINVRNGEIDNSPLCVRQVADERGEFRFPAPDSKFQLVIVHESGVAHVKSAPDSLPATIQLEPWATVTGTYRVGKTPQANVPITINVSGFGSYGQDDPRIYPSYDTTTGPDGRFVFRRVVPGSAFIGRRIFIIEGQGMTEVASSCMYPAMFPAGKTVEFNVGGSGRAVIGKLQPPAEYKASVQWNFCGIYTRIDLAPPAIPLMPADVEADLEKAKAWSAKWRESEAGKKWQAAYDEFNKVRDAAPDFTTSVARDGSFRIEDMPAGKYVLGVQFYPTQVGTLPPLRFTVPETSETASEEQIDLGVLTLEKSKQK